MSDEGRAAAEVSHSLKNALSLLATYPQLLGASDLDDDQREMVGEMLRAADRAIELHAALEALILSDEG